MQSVSGSALGSSIQASEIDALAVTTAKIAALAVTDAKMAIGYGIGQKIFFFTESAVGQGTWAWTDNTTDVVGQDEGYFANDSNADLDNITFPIFLAKGTYSLHVRYQTHTNAPIMAFDLDAVELATIDMYNGSSVWNNENTTASIVVATSAVYAFKIHAKDNNASSGGFLGRIQECILVRTA